MKYENFISIKLFEECNFQKKKLKKDILSQN